MSNRHISLCIFLLDIFNPLYEFIVHLGGGVRIGRWFVPTANMATTIVEFFLHFLDGSCAFAECSGLGHTVVTLHGFDGVRANQTISTWCAPLTLQSLNQGGTLTIANPFPPTTQTRVLALPVHVLTRNHAIDGSAIFFL